MSTPIYDLSGLTPEGIHYRKPGKGGGYFAPYAIPCDRVTSFVWREDQNGVREALEWEGLVYGQPDPETGVREETAVSGEIPIAEVNDTISTASTPSLDQLKAFAITTLKRNRDQALSGGFKFGGKRFQTRNQSDISNITNTGLAAMADPNFQTGFIAEDNTVIPMDSDTAKSFYAAMIQTGNGVWQQYALTRQQIEAATTKAELDAVDLTIQ